MVVEDGDDAERLGDEDALGLPVAPGPVVPPEPKTALIKLPPSVQ